MDLVAPWVIDGAMNGEIFDKYVETQLAPTLSKGDVVIADNLSSHKSPRAAELSVWGNARKLPIENGAAC